MPCRFFTTGGILFFFLALLFGSLFSGCSSVDSFNCPYVISDAGVSIGHEEGICNFASTRFSFFNDSSRTVKDFTVSFMLYDSEGENPFIGSNCIVSRISGEIAPSENAEIALSLDSWISVVPDEPYKLDFMYVRQIRYTDGSSWKDPFGMFASQEVYE